MNMQAIRMRRKELNMSQEKMANLLNVDRSTVAKWETGTLPRADKLPLIASVLNCTVDDLLNGITIRNS